MVRVRFSLLLLCVCIGGLLSTHALAYEPLLETRKLKDGEEVTLARWSFDLREVLFDIQNLSANKSKNLEALVRAKDARIAFNAGFFSEYGKPMGWVQDAHGLFSSLDPVLGGGVFVVDNKRGYLLSMEDAEKPRDIEFALQARPRLVVDGKVNIKRDDGKRADRTALCLRKDGFWLEVWVARTRSVWGEKGPTLYQFAHWMKDTGCYQALNLDGGPSTGVAWKVAKDQKYWAPRGLVVQGVVVRDRPVPKK